MVETKKLLQAEYNNIGKEQTKPAPASSNNNSRIFVDKQGILL